MREEVARRILSPTTAMALGLRAPNVTVIAVGEWSRPDGSDDWGVQIRDLRTGEERIVFDEKEWERISRDGLPDVGIPVGEPAMVTFEPDPGTKRLIEVERSLYNVSTGRSRVMPESGDSTSPSEVQSEDANLWVDGEYIGFLNSYFDDEAPGLFGNDEIEAFAKAIVRGTPKDQLNNWEDEGAIAAFDRAGKWAVQRRREGKETLLKSILDGGLALDVSGKELRFVEGTTAAKTGQSEQMASASDQRRRALLLGDSGPENPTNVEAGKKTLAQFVKCPVLSRSGSRVVLDTPVGRQEVHLGWYSSRFTYVGSTVGTSSWMQSIAIPLNLANRMSGRQKKCDHPLFLFWETPWRFSLFQKEAACRFLLCTQCGLSMGLRLE